MTDDTQPTAHPRSKQRFARFCNKARELSKLYMLVLPTTIVIAVLGYYPKIDVIVKSLYRWQPPDVEEYVGLQNFVDAFNDPIFWQSFRLVFVLLIANLFKMWPGIFAAIALHRISSDRLRYIFQVLFVVPMVIPSMVGLLIWKSFYDPSYGAMNRFLNASGFMRALHWLDGTGNAPGWMPRTAESLAPFITNVITPAFGSTWGLILIGSFLCMFAIHGNNNRIRHNAAGLLFAASLLPVAATSISAPGILFVSLVLFIVLMGFLARTLGPKWVVWMFLILGSLYAFRTNYLLIPASLAITFMLAEVIRASKERFAAEATLKWVGSLLIVFAFFLIFFGETWTYPTGQFEFGSPAWLGSQDLVIPAILFWGFPWVGTMGVLIYLAGLQQIPQDVYEAAEIDGIGPMGMLFKIELPLILTQVRINLIFMTIGTLVSYEMFLILLGPGGGPGNKGMVPGLYMFQKAFEDGEFGYACALGMVLFFLILGLTVIYNKYVKVEK